MSASEKNELDWYIYQLTRYVVGTLSQRVNWFVIKEFCIKGSIVHSE
jgi:hypothetical protein